MQEGFGRDAADIDAHAAQLFLLHDGGGEAELGAADGADVSRGSATQNDHVEGSHSRSLLGMME